MNKCIPVPHAGQDTGILLKCVPTEQGVHTLLFGSAQSLLVQQLLQHDPPIALIEWKQGVDICAHVITMEEARQIAQALVAVLTAPPTSKL